MKALHSSVNDMAGAYERVAIFGAGVSGQAARRLAAALGLDGCLFDEGGAGEASEFLQDDLGGFDAFIFSPGFALTHPWRMLAEGSGLPCYSELGFAALHWRGRLLGVTGTNGKTTITSLLCDALESAGQIAVEAGNIGTPLSDVVLSDANQAEAIAVCEISSFQAELPLGLQLDGLIWSNFAEDHLDRYDSMTEYFAAKAKLLSCLRADAPSVLGADVVAFDSRVVDIRNSIVVDGDSALVEALAPQSPFCIQPQRTNFALVAALWSALDLPEGALVDSANVFQLAAHRLSQVATWGGVSFWNDSKATNFHAALAALDALDAPIFWIGGGSGKGGDLDAFAQLVASKVEAAFVYGVSAPSLAEVLCPLHVRVEVHSDFVEAVEAAVRAALANAPSVVLLSPGFASFDQFPGYAARGKSFISTVLSLKDAHRPS
ncbi:MULTISPECIES: UDP-N-acetylmuramoyl-L-alanine--D-glutamate ligase [unclassified Lentimonas]|uniref:UDP-N-acetylmuramoyl-L-alanine--D-glutamate ligase n=2 Tax=Lentimonas TaxID=417293 RepID=UPI001389E0AA|nr:MULTISPECIES: UDP-N-acetylmuramoyl-L-alanine--D-glutamate ligase [unclassified Lentimonas]